MTRVYDREAFYVPVASLKKSTVKKVIEENTLRFYEEKSCKKCSFYEDRMAHPKKHLGECDPCSAYMGATKLSYRKTVKSKEYLTVPAGDRELLQKYVPDANLVAKHPTEDVDIRKIKFTGKLKPEQEAAVQAILKKKRGVVKLPPRSGKTVLSVAAICRIDRKTIILTSQREWLVGFYETFCGSDTQDPLTNAKKPRVGFPRNLNDFDKYDVCLVTYQKFLSESGQKLLKKVKSKFTAMFIDEVHGAAAPGYAKVVSQFNCEFKIGLSGTPTRKDMRHAIMHKLIGPIVYTAKMERLKPTVRLTRTAFKEKGSPKMWATLVSHLENDKARLKLIAEYAIKDAKSGHMVLIPLTRVQAIKDLTALINKLANKKNYARAFYGGVKKADKDDIITSARQYKLKIIVGNIKLLSTGINIPRASCLYEASLSSNLENCEQRISRILTPWDDKPPPIIRIFLDDYSVRKACLSNEWWQCIWPQFKPIISNPDYQTLKTYLTRKKRPEFDLMAIA